MKNPLDSRIKAEVNKLSTELDHEANSAIVEKYTELMGMLDSAEEKELLAGAISLNLVHREMTNLVADSESEPDLHTLNLLVSLSAFTDCVDSSLANKITRRLLREESN